MKRLDLFLTQLERESDITRKMLSIVPDNKFDWKPHPKSMNIRELAGHIAELPTWIGMALHTDALDFADNPYEAPKINSNQQLMEFFETSFQQGKTELTNGNEESLGKPWQLKNDGQVLWDANKAEVIETTLSQIIHHRAQLGVFLRLLDVPIPGTYGPSADEM